MSSNPGEWFTQPLSTEQAVWVVGSLAGVHRKCFDANLLVRRFALPWDHATLFDALTFLGLKAGLVPWPDMARVLPPLPAVAFARGTAGDEPGTPVLLTRRHDGRFALFRQGEPPRQLDELDRLRKDWQPWVLLCADHSSVALAPSGRMA